MSSQLQEILERSKNLVFFGGAGVSTESGIPDFRSPDGLYSAQKAYGHTPEEMLSHDFFARHPQEFFSYYRETLLHDAAPNSAHRALVELERMGKLRAIVTQNIDGLHQRAGSQVVHELHVSVERNYCTACGLPHPADYIRSPEKADGPVPLCTDCGGIVRPDVVLYQEALGEEVIEAAIQAIEAADTLLVAGTSLVVYPAAGFLQYYRGDALVLINHAPTPYDDRAALVLRDSIGETLSAAVMNIS